MWFWLHGYWGADCFLAMAAAKLLGIPLLMRAESTLIGRPRSGFKLTIKRIFFSILRNFIDAVLPVSSRNQGILDRVPRIGYSVFYGSLCG